MKQFELKLAWSMRDFAMSVRQSRDRICDQTLCLSGHKRSSTVTDFY